MLIVEYLTRPEKQRQWTLAQRKRWQDFNADYEANIDRLYYQLRYMAWNPQPFIIFDKQEGKKRRRIYESYPESLVVDTLLLDCLNYVFMERKHIIPQSCYGSIKGKGQHELRAQIIKLVHGRKNLFAYVGDTSKYYPTMNHKILLDTFAQHIKCKWMLWLCNQCVKRIDGIVGIALGLPSSNPIGHIYHAIIDWFVLLGMKVRRYYRFCDDKWAFHRDVNYLHTVAREIRDKTGLLLNQNIKGNWRVLNCTEERFDCLGALINSHGARLKNYCRRRIERHIKRIIREGDPAKALRTWSGINGSLVNLSVSNLIDYWKEVYPEFFLLVRWRRKMLKEEKRMKRWHGRLEKILTNAPDCRSAEIKILYPYGFVNTKEGEAA